MLNSQIKKALFAALLLAVLCFPVFSDDALVSIYRDYDDGLFGRSLYRGVIFSVKLESFIRYNSFPVKDVDGTGNNDGLTGYLLSESRADDLKEGRGNGVTILDSEKKLYSFNRDGISIEFGLEKAPPDFYEEISRTYNNLLSDSERAQQVIREVKKSYESGYLIRVYRAENVYRPQYTGIEYEDVLISAALIADSFQPLWGIHDGNDLTSPAD